MIARFVVRLSSVVLAAMLASCGGGDGGKEGTDVPVAPDAVEDGAPVDQLPGEQVAPPDNQVGPDSVEVVPDAVPQAQCDPACDYGKGQYCDEADWTCKDIECTSCLKSKDCPEGQYCLEHQFANSTWGTFCTSDCQQDGDCPAGFTCFGNPGFCRPSAACQFDACGTGALGEACDYKGSNSECGACNGADLTCFGTAPDPAAPCVTDQDCVAAGFPPALHPDCTKGICGTSYCAGKCDANFGCEPGFDAMNAGFGKCYCVPTTSGSGKAGDPCPIFNVHFEKDFCGPDLTCLGIEAKADAEDPEANKCETVADCDPSLWFLNPDCVDGYCGTSFCSPACDANDECPAGFFPIDVSGQCFCAPTEVGDAEAGDPCPIFGVNPEADACKAGLICLGIAADEGTLECNKAEDCAGNWYPGGKVCENGYCGSSFCSAKCTVTEQDGEEVMTCPDGFEPADVGTSCYCIPTYTGASKQGDPCPFGNINGSSDECVKDVLCAGAASDLLSVECTKASDCPASYAGAPQCFKGKCGTSTCVGECDEMGDCPAGYVPWLFAGGFCYCVGPGEAPGNRKAGETCGFFSVNPDAGACEAGLACFGIGASGTAPGEDCKVDADCSFDDYPGNPKCVEGYCVTSFCAPKCDANLDCEPGYQPIPVEEGACYCSPVQTGDAVEGDPCPFATVHADADFCLPELVCLGIPAEETVPCEKDADCAYTPYLGNPVCQDGWCGTSFCSAKCDADGLCPEGYEPLDVGAEGKEKCYCAPAVVGEAKVGEPCPLYNVNSAAAYCLEDLECIGSPAVAATDVCLKGTDCPADLYLGSPVCFMGHCGSSVCLAPCGKETLCADSGAWLFGESGCFCLPEVKAATSKAGQSCPLFNVNAKAPACQAGLACTGSGAFLGGTPCKDVSECKAEDYPGIADCVDGFCGSSYCAAPCDAEGKCAAGLEALTTETDHCFCVVP